MSGYIEEEWLEDTFIRELNFEEWVEKEWVEVEITKLVEPLEITHSEEGFLALGLAILPPESYATPMNPSKSLTVGQNPAEQCVDGQFWPSIL